MAHPHDNSEFAEFETQLAAFVPREARLDQARVLFLAGREAARSEMARGHLRWWRWPLATAALMFLSAGLGWQLGHVRPELVDRPTDVLPADPDADSIPAAAPEQRVKTPAVAEVPSPLFARAPKPSQPRAADYLRQREVAFTFGLDALGAPLREARDAGPEQLSLRDLRQGLLDP